jgi:hypothetical protein
MFHVWRQTLLARVLGIAAELGIADLVADSPKSAEALAAVTGAHADALYRVLRMFASHEVTTRNAFISRRVQLFYGQRITIRSTSYFASPGRMWHGIPIASFRGPS